MSVARAAYISVASGITEAVPKSEPIVPMPKSKPRGVAKNADAQVRMGGIEPQSHKVDSSPSHAHRQ